MLQEKHSTRSTSQPAKPGKTWGVERPSRYDGFRPLPERRHHAGFYVIHPTTGLRTSSGPVAGASQGCRKRCHGDWPSLPDQQQDNPSPPAASGIQFYQPLSGRERPAIAPTHHARRNRGPCVESPYAPLTTGGQEHRQVQGTVTGPDCACHHASRR